MKSIACLILFINGFLLSPAQDLQVTRTGKVSFHAGSSLEDIDATNNEVASALNTKAGEIVFNVLVKSFHFRRALMEEHFNENYMESDKFPKAVFTGKFDNWNDVTLSKDGLYTVNAEGDLTIHGITKRMSVPATIAVSNGKVAARTRFKIKPESFNISIPGVVADKFSKEIEIVIECNYDPR